MKIKISNICYTYKVLSLAGTKLLFLIEFMLGRNLRSGSRFRSVWFRANSVAKSKKPFPILGNCFMELGCKFQ